MYDYFLQVNLACVNANLADKEWTCIDQNDKRNFLQEELTNCYDQVMATAKQKQHEGEETKAGES